MYVFLDLHFLITYFHQHLLQKTSLYVILFKYRIKLIYSIKNYGQFNYTPISIILYM